MAPGFKFSEIAHVSEDKNKTRELKEAQAQKSYNYNGKWGNEVVAYIDTHPGAAYGQVTKALSHIAAGSVGSTLFNLTRDGKLKCRRQGSLNRYYPVSYLFPHDTNSYTNTKFPSGYDANIKLLNRLAKDPNVSFEEIKAQARHDTKGRYAKGIKDILILAYLERQYPKPALISDIAEALDLNSNTMVGTLRQLLNQGAIKDSHRGHYVLYTVAKSNLLGDITDTSYAPAPKPDFTKEEPIKIYAANSVDKDEEQPFDASSTIPQFADADIPTNPMEFTPADARADLILAREIISGYLYTTRSNGEAGSLTGLIKYIEGEQN